MSAGQSSWLDFVPPRDRYLADTDDAYREALHGTVVGRMADLHAAWWNLRETFADEMRELARRLSRRLSRRRERDA